MKKKTEEGLSRRKFLGAATAGLVAGGALLVGRASGGTAEKKAETPAEDKHACKGMNSCKGKGGCKSGDAKCAGKNSCKGKGGCAVPAAGMKKSKAKEKTKTDKNACGGKNGCGAADEKKKG